MFPHIELRTAVLEEVMDIPLWFISDIPVRLGKQRGLLYRPNTPQNLLPSLPMLVSEVCGPSNTQIHDSE